jgi:hypothetical protein
VRVAWVVSLRAGAGAEAAAPVFRRLAHEVELWVPEPFRRVPRAAAGTRVVRYGRNPLRLVALSGYDAVVYQPSGELGRDDPIRHIAAARPGLVIGPAGGLPALALLPLPRPDEAERSAAELSATIESIAAAAPLLALTDRVAAALADVGTGTDPSAVATVAEALGELAPPPA